MEPIYESEEIEFRRQATSININFLKLIFRKAKKKEISYIKTEEIKSHNFFNNYNKLIIQCNE